MTKIVSTIEPQQIILFGSAATGKMSDQSDFDFVIVMDTVANIKLASKKISRLMPLSKVPIDIVWTTEEIFNEKSAIGGVLMVAAQEGQTLYGKRND